MIFWLGIGFVTGLILGLLAILIGFIFVYCKFVWGKEI